MLQYSNISETIKGDNEYGLKMKCLVPIVLSILEDANFLLKELSIDMIVAVSAGLKTDDLESLILTSN